MRKEVYVQPWLRKIVRKNAFGVYFAFKSMEQGPSFRVTVPKFPTKDPNHRILARQKILGPFVMRVATFFPFQTTYYLNGIDAYEHEPTCTQSSGPAECAGMIRCDTRIWGDAAQSVIGQSGRHGWGGNTGASAMPYRSDACFFILFQVPFFGSTRAAEHSSVPTAKSCSRRAQGEADPKRIDAFCWSTVPLGLNWLRKGNASTTQIRPSDDVV